MVRQKMGAWIRGRKRSRFQKELDISEQQADKLLSIMSMRPLSRKRKKSEGKKALQKILSSYEFEPAALESLVEKRLLQIKIMLENKVQAFAIFAGALDQSQRIALSEMMTSCGHSRRRHF